MLLTRPRSTCSHSVSLVFTIITDRAISLSFVGVLSHEAGARPGMRGRSKQRPYGAAWRHSVAQCASPRTRGASGAPQWGVPQAFAAAGGAGYSAALPRDSRGGTDGVGPGARGAM